jgi:L-fuculose-phosphate aldolase
VEILAEQYVKVLQLGAPHILDAAEMERVLAKFKDYGANTKA